MSSQRGFTLVEMLVALSVAALLTGLVYSAIRVSHRSVDAVFNYLDTEETARIGWQYLRSAISRAQPFSTDPTDEQTGFAGTRTYLAFIADMPAYTGAGGLTRISLGAEPVADGTALRLERHPVALEGDDAPGGDRQDAILVERLQRLEIDYLGSPSEGEPVQWRDRWQSGLRLPNLVRIRVQEQGQRPWPVLIARPMRGAGSFDGSNKSLAGAISEPDQ